ncbi:unnamed protein product, partial [Mesorhabditis spiculigera]
MKYLLLAVLCSLGLHGVFSGSCAPGAVDYIEVGQCLLVFKVAAPFAVASKTCGALSGKLAQPISRVENLLTSIAARRTVNATTRVHIGIKRADGRVDRIYADGTPLQYYNFYSESDWASADACTTLDPSTQQWYSTPCDALHPFACQYSNLDNTLMCPDGWKYYELTSSCYYIQNVISSTKALHLNQTAAAAQCAKLGGQLASIHTDAENTFVKNFIQTSDPDVNCQDWQALIGASCKNNQTTWSDGTPFDFDLTNGQCTDAYTMINDYHCSVDQRQNWQSWYAQNEFSRFICKRAALHLPEVGERIAMEFMKQH